MRLWALVFLTGVLEAAASSQSGGHTSQRFVLLDFAERHVSIFVLGESDLSKFTPKDAGLKVVADSAKRTLRVSGIGEMSYGRHVIALSGAGVAVDGKPLSSKSRNFVLTPTGEIHEGFVRTFDGKPGEK